jgi:hypothetical protein
MGHMNAVASPPAKAAEPTRLLQRACSCGGKGQKGECESCRRKRLQRAPDGAAPPPAGAMTGTDFSGGGNRLSGAARHALEPLFGTSFDAVRVHDDSRSHALARAFEARAFTVGQDIHFATGEYRPHDRRGLALLAHELTHTLQQGGTSTGAAGAGAVEVDRTDSPLEREADAAAGRVLAGRRVAVTASGARGLVQRAPAAGSTAETRVRTIDENTRVTITRTLTPRSCEARPRTESTARRDIFYWDEAARAVGMRYSLCHGRVRLSSTASLDYNEVLRTGERLLDTLRTNPAAGNDIGGLLQGALDTTHVTARGEINLTVDGILRAQVSGAATVGTTDQRYSVRGILTVTPTGVSFRVTGGIDVARTPLQSTTTYTLEGTGTTRFGAITLRYSQIDTSAVGGAPASERSLSATATVPLPDVGPLSGQSAGIGASVDPSTGHVTPIVEWRGRFGGPERTERVECYDCDCPPPLPEYRCTRTVDPHSRRVVDQPAGHRTSRLLFAYDSDAPADATVFQEQIAGLSGMVQHGYEVQAIRGYASPEASRAYNLALGQRRADHARGALQAAISAGGGSAALPPAQGVGELLGESSARAGREAANADLVRELTARLSPLSDDARLDLLGVDGPSRSDPAQRAQALADVQAFIDGRDANGQRLGTRARWEKIFPFLRRVEIEVDRQERAHQEPVRGGETPGCSEGDLEWARANMSEIPPRQRLPAERCRS